MRNFHEFIPIIILVFIAAICAATAVIISIRSRKSLLGINDKDFIDEAAEKKKRALNASIGGMSWRNYVALLVASPIVLGVISYLLLPQKAFCIVFAFFGVFVPEAIVRMTAKKQKAAFEKRYTRALKALASALRSGMSLEQSIESVGKNPFIDEHIRTGFRQIYSDIKVGIPIEQTFRRFAADSGSKDAEDVAAAISMQAKVGGSEAVVVSTIAQNIVDRLMARREIKALFADTDILVAAMDVVPWLLLVILYFCATQLIAPFFESIAMTITLIAIMVFTTVGSFVIRKLVSSAKEG